MTNLKTTYMGIELSNPFIVGACDLTADLEKIRQIEEMGASALVTRTLFEEQVELERFKFEEDLHKFDNRYAEMITVFPNTEYAGPKEHLMWVREAKKAVRIPVFASLHAVHRETWFDYARRLEDTGVDGLECNLYSFPADPWKPSGEIENEQVELVRDLVEALSIPISVKLTPSYTNPMSMVSRLGLAGASGLVLFNRPFEPDLDVHQEKVIRSVNLSSGNDSRPAIRYIGLLSEATEADFCASGGILTAEHVVKMLLAGAKAVQTVGVLYRYGIPHLRVLRQGLEDWMSAKGYTTLDAFRGKLSRSRVPGDPWAYTRAQYIKLMMDPSKIVDNAPVL